MSDDDWAPLPPDQLGSRPGDCIDVGKRAPPPAPQAAAAPPRTLEQQREAERTVMALQQRLARAAPATSLVAAVLHRELEAERVQHAVQRPELTGTIVHAADGAGNTAATADVPVVEYAPGRDGRDDREDSDWFAALPAAEQQRLRDVWAGKRVAGATSTSRQRRVGNRRFVAALVVFAGVFALGSGVSWHATAGASILCGLWWRHSGADRLLDPIRAATCFFALHSLALAVHGGSNPGMVWDAVFVVVLASLVGFDGEMRRSGGFDPA